MQGALGKIFGNIFKNSGDDVVSKLSANYSDDFVKKLATSKADDIAAQHGNLIATHQLTPDKLRGVADMGGFVQPSMAVVDPSKGTNFLPGSDFGDIVMIPNRSAIDPKVKAAKTFIGDRDIYSPRFPDSTYKVNMDVLDDLAKQSGQSRQYALSNIDINTDDPSFTSFLQDVYRKNNPDVADIQGQMLRDVPEFKQYANDTLESLRGDRVLEYRQPSGRYKELPFTADNANKIMNRVGAVGTEQGWVNPGATAYHQNTKQIKSLDDLYKNRYRFIDNSTGEVTKDAMNDEMTRIVDKIDKLGIDELRDTNPYTQYDRAANYVNDVMDNRPDIYPSLDRVPRDVIDEISSLKRAYQEVPTSYFEAKPRRVVGGNEFYGAYVPKDSPQQVFDDLQRLGVQNINTYIDAGDLDLALSQLAKEGKRGISPYVLGVGGAIPTAGMLGSLLSGGQSDQQQMV